MPSKEVKPSPEKTQVTAEDEVLLIDSNLKKVNYKLAKCCNPQPGDEVFGFVTISRGITIHRHDCPNAGQLLNRFGYRKIDVQWKGYEKGDQSRVTIQVTGNDRVGIMNEISQIISNDIKANMIGVKIEVRKGQFNGILKLLVTKDFFLNELLQKISKVSGVTRAVKIH